MVRRAVAMTIAGSDSGGGAGVAADLKTFEAHGVWGTLALAAVTAQNTVGVQAVEAMQAELVRAQIDSVVTDIGVDAAKTGTLASAELVVVVADAVRRYRIEHLVVDPVFASTTGDALLAADAVGALRDQLMPLAEVITPNLPEASALAGFDIVDRAGMEEAARRILSFGPSVVMVKGGHLDADDSPDLVLGRGEQALWIEAERLPVCHTHGTGCVLSAAITAELAKGMSPVDACVAAKHFVTRAIAAGLDLGSGVGPVDPGWAART